MMTSPMDRIQILDNIEKEIANSLQHAGQALNELSRDKSANKQVEGHIQQFIKTLGGVETELSKQINYLTQVSTGQAHEGSSYRSQKALQMTWHRLEHIRSEVSELEKLKSNPRIQTLHQQLLQQSSQQPQQFSTSHQSLSNQTHQST